MTGPSVWAAKGILRTQPWSVQFRLPIAVSAGQLTISRPVGANPVQLAVVAGVVTGRQRVVTFALTGAQTAALPACTALADVWLWPVTGTRFRLFRATRLPILDPVAQGPGGPGSGGGSSHAGLYPSAILFPAADHYPETP